MCGIAGFIDFNGKLNEENLVAMTDVLAHRGPDGSGYQMLNYGKIKVGLGHRRLSIIDLSEGGKQPLYRNDWVIVFNGEIYNYKEIKKDLLSLKHTFQSNSDTEVIVAAFEEWGIDAVKRFNGMFAFVIYNQKQKKVWFVKDRTGVKPLYVYEKDGLLLFASELKAFHQVRHIELEIDENAIQLYFKHGRVPTPYCIYKNCYKVQQGSYITIDLINRKREEDLYWNILDYTKKSPIKDLSGEAIIQETESLLTSAFNYRMIADVPVGIFLSGGYDSSLVAALLQKNKTEAIKTFTIGFESNEYDESRYATQVAKHLGTEHNTYICTEATAKKIVPLLPFIFDEPFGDSSCIPTYIVSKIARQQVTVALSADGGDEQFVGYKRYIKAIKIASFIQQKPAIINKSIGYALKWAGSGDIINKISEILLQDSINSIPNIQTQLLTDNKLKRLLKQYKPTTSTPIKKGSINSLFASDYQNYLQDDILVKVDRATMAVGLEGREPFLDYRIAEWAMKLPVQAKYKNSTLKYLLKEITHKYIPKEIMDRPKKGFSLPINNWLRKELNYLMQEAFEESFLLKQDLFSLSYLMERKNKFLCNKDNGEFMWHFIMFQLWYKKWHT